MRTQAYTASDRARRQAAADEAPPSIPPRQWGLCPARTAGNGIQQEPCKFLAWVRKVLVLHLRLLALTGELDALQRAGTFLRGGLAFADPACTADLAG